MYNKSMIVDLISFRDYSYLQLKEKNLILIDIEEKYNNNYYSVSFYQRFSTFIYAVILKYYYLKKVIHLKKSKNNVKKDKI